MNAPVSLDQARKDRKNGGKPPPPDGDADDLLGVVVHRSTINPAGRGVHAA